MKTFGSLCARSFKVLYILVYIFPFLVAGYIASSWGSQAAAEYEMGLITDIEYTVTTLSILLGSIIFIVLGVLVLYLAYDYTVRNYNWK